MSADAAPPAARRRRELDLLRIAACLIQFPFHTGKVFDHDPNYHIKNLVESGLVDAFTSFAHIWRMPLFFFIAGWAAVTALGSRSPAIFLTDRLKRLGPPLLVGLVLFAPAIKYLERLSGRDLRPTGLVAEPRAFALDYWTWLGHFFGRLNQFSWSHLWFIVYLLLFSVALLPALRALARHYDRMPAGPAWLVGPALVCAGIELGLRPIFGDLPNLYRDWANIPEFVLFFLLGAVVAREPAVEAGIAARWPGLLAAGLAGAALHIWFGTASPLGALGRGFAAWCLVAGLLGLGQRLGGSRTAFDRYLGEATFPLYVLHHLPVVALAFLIVPLDWPLWAKAATICAGSAALSFALYHFAIRPWRPTRMLFGMRPRG